MIRTALDSENLHVFTTNVDFIFTYSDLVTDPREFERAYPGQQVRYIDRGMGDPQDKATIVDVERFARRPADVPGWLDGKLARKHSWLTVYANRTTMPEVDEMAHPRQFSRWYATLDGTAHIVGYEPMHWPALVQVIGAAELGIDADFSLVFSDGWNPSPPAPIEVARRQAIDHALSAMATASAQLMAAHADIQPYA